MQRLVACLLEEVESAMVYPQANVPEDALIGQELTDKLTRDGCEDLKKAVASLETPSIQLGQLCKKYEIEEPPLLQESKLLMKRVKAAVLKWGALMLMARIERDPVNKEKPMVSLDQIWKTHAADPGVLKVLPASFIADVQVTLGIVPTAGVGKGAGKDL